MSYYLVALRILAKAAFSFCLASPAVSEFEDFLRIRVTALASFLAAFFVSFLESTT